MASRSGPEFFDVQRPGSELLRSVFGYTVLDGQSPDFAKERDRTSEVILVERLARKLQEINGPLTDTQVRTAIDTLRRPKATSLLEANEELHNLLSRWITVEETLPDGRTVGRSVRYIDFENPANNEFLVVEEFGVKGLAYERRLDLVLFINGIPIVAIECKAPDDKAGIKLAIDQLGQYQREADGIPQLFASILFTVATKGMDARYGTIDTPAKYFAEWKDPWPMTRDELFAKLGRNPTVQDVLFAGLFAPANLLEHLRNFVVYEGRGGRKVKKVARYQQFQAVNLAYQRALEATVAGKKEERGGVVWHTQGSGKSLTMLWLAVKLRRAKELNNPMLLVVTDRRDLDKQITQTFIACGFPNPIHAARSKPKPKETALPPPLGKKPKKPKDPDDSRTLLSSSKGQTIMTTVQKFRDDYDREKRRSKHPVLSEAENIFVLVDEAHRSQYDIFAAAMEKALPNACRMAFTGTPLIQGKKSTTRVFGSYIHKYTMAQSERDGATVPIKYEARMPVLAVWGNKIDPIFEAEFADLTPEQREKIKNQHMQEIDIALAENRIEQIAFDIYEHYTKTIEPNGFKAQVVACSQRAAARYYHALDKYEHLAGRVILLISDPKRGEADLLALKEKFVNEDELVRSFVEDPLDRVAIMIVVDKYLTGFDAPIEQVMYLDKRLQDHGLLQAIARVNRPCSVQKQDLDPATGEPTTVTIDKEYGLVVDYWGIAERLDKALAVFAKEDVDPATVWTQRDGESAVADLRQKQREVFGLFDPKLTREALDPWVESLAPEDQRAAFERASRAFMKALDQLLPDKRALAFLDDAKWLEDVRRKVRRDYYVEDLAVTAASAKVRKLIDQHVKTEEIVQLLPPVPILSERFAEEVSKLTSGKAKTERMIHAIRKEITEKLPENPAMYESVQKRLERIIDERRQARISEVEAYKQLVIEYEKLKAEAKQSDEWAGKSRHARPFFNLLDSKLDSLPNGDGQARSERKRLSEDLVELLEREAVIDWVDKEDVQRAMRRSIKRRLREADISPDRIEEVTASVMDLARARLIR